MKHFSFTLLLSLLILAAKAQVSPMPIRPGVRTQLAPFYHGVASGDPLADRVIIWTRITPTASGAITVTWQMATDTLFNHVVNSGSVSADTSTDYTVKVDVTGLTANTWYYYRFKSGIHYSLIGRTKTLPTGNCDSLRFAVYSCSDFQAGYFNAYKDISKRNDIQAIIHLGDYYYEYKAGGSGYANDTNRMHCAAQDALTLSDYRLWQSQYKLDSDLSGLHQQYPAIQVWDDHEIANNGWYSGAQNHNWSTQGNWFDRKKAAKTAYFEWNPIRETAAGNDTIIHRNFQFGNLMNLIMLDTRFEGRDSSLGTAIPVTNTYMNDTNRNILGPVQLNWLKGQLSDTGEKWRIIGNQVMIAPLTLSIFSTLVLNGDQWDGYPAERKRVYDHIAANNIKNVVFLSGDIHSSWANDLPHPDSTYVSSTGTGSIATEFIGSSITSTAGISTAASTIMAADPWFKYIDFTLRGYLLFDVNKTRVQGDYIHVSTTASRTFTTTNDAQWQNLDGERHLRRASAPLGSNPGNPPLVVGYPSTTGVPQINKNGLVVFNCYPNPGTNEINLQYYLDQPGDLNILITDINGRTIVNDKASGQVSGLQVAAINIADVTKGMYILQLISGESSYTTRFVKQ